MDKKINKILDLPYFNELVESNTKETITRLFELSDEHDINAFSIYYLIKNLSTLESQKPLKNEGGRDFIRLANYLKFCHENGLITDKENSEKVVEISNIISNIDKRENPF